jgi:YHS domain-containing protein
MRAPLATSFLVVCLGLICGCGATAARPDVTETLCPEGTAPQTVCPIAGTQIDKRYYSDYMQKRVYFCCPECVGAFEERPEYYIRKMEDEGICIQRIQE